jgi:hypothetical protein
VGEEQRSGRTDMIKLIVAFRNLANTPKKDNDCFFVTFFKLMLPDVLFSLLAVAKFM